MKRWNILNSTYAFVCPWLKVRKDNVKLPSGLEIEDFYIVEANDWVNVIAITEEGKFLIEEQYLPGCQKICFELPAGNVEVGETPLYAAQRELLEETGYTGGVWMPFGIYIPNTSGMNNLCHTFIARGGAKNSSFNIGFI